VSDRGPSICPYCVRRRRLWRRPHCGQAACRAAFSDARRRLYAVKRAVCGVRSYRRGDAEGTAQPGRPPVERLRAYYTAVAARLAAGGKDIAVVTCWEADKILQKKGQS